MNMEVLAISHKKTNPKFSHIDSLKGEDNEFCFDSIF